MNGTDDTKIAKGKKRGTKMTAPFASPYQGMDQPTLMSGRLMMMMMMMMMMMIPQLSVMVLLVNAYNIVKMQVLTKNRD